MDPDGALRDSKRSVSTAEQSRPSSTRAEVDRLERRVIGAARDCCACISRVAGMLEALVCASRMRSPSPSSPARPRRSVPRRRRFASPAWPRRRGRPRRLLLLADGLASRARRPRRPLPQAPWDPRSPEASHATRGARRERRSAVVPRAQPALAWTIHGRRPHVAQARGLPQASGARLDARSRATCRETSAGSVRKTASLRDVRARP